jgi:two-component system, chemotaxis family, CheB/CheR fusion protein
MTADAVQSANLIPVAAIGASMTALDPLIEVLSSLDSDGLAYVVVLYGGPAEIPEKLHGCSLPVLPVTDGAVLKKDHVYVATGASSVTVHGERLRLHEQTDGLRLAIDHLFRSVATERNSGSIGILLEGTRSDGLYGLEAIRAEGGLSILQDKVAARQSLPQADLSLPAKEIAREVRRVVAHPLFASRKDADREDFRPELTRIFGLLRQTFGTDISLYKQSTIERRIERRMNSQRLERLSDYVRLLQSHPDELGRLYRECLIGVTSFFRDHEPFELLKTLVVPRIIDRLRPDQPLRVWVPGCSTGEEAYSIAIAILEVLGSRADETKLQIFASDLNPAAISFARRGVYPASITEDVSTARLQRFFTRYDGHFQIARRIRDLVVFAHQDVTKDPPFSHVDLVSCRNLLIYLQPGPQKKVLRVFHHALKPDGFLLLGSSETIGENAELFSVVDKGAKIFGKRNTPVPAHLDISPMMPLPHPVETPRIRPEVRPMLTIQQLADRRVLEKYGPPGILVNESFEVLQFRGRVGPYLEPTSGQASLNLLKLIRPDMLLDLRGALQKALSESITVTIRINLHEGNELRPVAVEVLPLNEPETRSRCLLVVFDDSSPAVPLMASTPPTQGEEDRFETLSRELSATKEYLQSTIEALETANEELKSSNEELQSSNEELQSTNEELETSKEEIQSTNEELSTVNDELQGRMQELSESTDDLQNLVGAVSDPILMVGIDLRIRRFTPTAEALLGLTPADIGRPLNLLRPLLGAVDLDALTMDAIDRLAERREEILAKDGRWYLLRVAPYRTADHAIRGATLTLFDIDGRKRRGELDATIDERAALALGAISQAVLVVDADLRVRWANPAYYETFQTAAKETIGNLLQNLGNGQWAHPKLRALLAATLEDGTPFRRFRMEHTFPQVGFLTVRLSARRLADQGVQNLAVLTIDEEVRDEPKGP